MDNRLRRRKKRVYFCFLLITAVLLFLYWPFDLSSSFSTTPKAKELRKEKDAVEPTKIETQERIVIKGSNTSLDNTQNDPPNLTPEIIVIKSAPPYVPVPRIRLKSVPEPPKNEVDDRKDVIHDMTSENTAPRKTPEIIIIKKANQELTAPPLATQEKIVIKSALPETPPVTKAHSKDEKESHNEEKNKKTSSDSNSGKSIGRDAKLDPESHEINENNDERFISVDNLPSFGWRYLFENQKRDTMIEVESLCFDEYNQPFFYTDTSGLSCSFVTS